jgi:uncharacterized protein YaaQ
VFKRQFLFATDEQSIKEVLDRLQDLCESRSKWYAGNAFQNHIFFSPNRCDGMA